MRAQRALIVVLASAGVVVEGVSCAAGGVAYTGERAQRVVAPLRVQTVVLAALALVDVLAVSAVAAESVPGRAGKGGRLQGIASERSLLVDAGLCARRAPVAALSALIDVDANSTVARGVFVAVFGACALKRTDRIGANRRRIAVIGGLFFIINNLLSSKSCKLNRIGFLLHLLSDGFDCVQFSHCNGERL